MQFTPFDKCNIFSDGHFSRCKSLAAISDPNPDHAMATWPHSEIFPDCPKQLRELLAAAAAAMQLRHYWHPGQDGHALCLAGPAHAGLSSPCSSSQRGSCWQTSKHSTAAHGQCRQRRSRQVALTALPDLPDELWLCILSFIRRQELGGAVVHELERELEPATNGSGIGERESGEREIKQPTSIPTNKQSRNQSIITEPSTGWHPYTTAFGENCRYDTRTVSFNSPTKNLAQNCAKLSETAVDGSKEAASSAAAAVPLEKL